MGSYLPARPVRPCHACGRLIDHEAVVCTSCGVMQPLPPELATDKHILPAGLLCVFLGVFGAHRFYVGKTGTALLQLFTLRSSSTDATAPFTGTIPFPYRCAQSFVNSAPISRIIDV
jgi:hypothetical protein